MYKENCEATHIRGDQSAEVLDLRMACLQDRLGGLRALTEVFVNASGEVVENAVNAANALSSLDRCADVPLFRAVVRPPEDPDIQIRVNAIRIRLADQGAVRCRPLEARGWRRLPRSLPNPRASATSPDCRALMLQGDALIDAGEPARAEKSFVTAVLGGGFCAARRDPRQKRNGLVFVVGYWQGRFEDAFRWATAARSPSCGEWEVTNCSDPGCSMTSAAFSLFRA